jgi:hypothetical protein
VPSRREPGSTSRSPAGRSPSSSAPATDDGRASLLSLTAAGAGALAATRALRSEWALGALAGWDEDDARTLTDLLDRLVADLEAAGAPHGTARAAVPTPR